MMEAFGAPTANGQASDEIGDIAKATIAGRTATLLIEVDRLIPGAIDIANGEIIHGDLNHPKIDDALDDLGERVLKTGGEVVIVPAGRLLTKSGAAASYRF